MDKTIELVMNEDKSITINVNTILKYTICENAREIAAQNIYELVDYKIGDNLCVSMKNEKEIDAPVLLFFKDLFDDTCKRINELNFNEDDTVLKTEQNEGNIV